MASDPAGEGGCMPAFRVAAGKGGLRLTLSPISGRFGSGLSGLLKSSSARSSEKGTIASAPTRAGRRDP